MRHIPGTALTLLALAGLPAMGASLSKQDYQAAKKGIAAEYEAERQKCAVRVGNDLQLCVARAHGVRDVRNAELEAEYKPGPRTYYDAAMARAKSAYAVAKEECDQKRGTEKAACKRDAKTAFDNAKADAKRARI